MWTICSLCGVGPAYIDPDILGCVWAMNGEVDTKASAFLVVVVGGGGAEDVGHDGCVLCDKYLAFNGRGGVVVVSKVSAETLSTLE